MPRFRVIRLVVILLGLPTSAWAACGERDLEGSWNLKAESKGDRGNITMTCELALTGEGAIRPGTACTQKNAQGMQVLARVEGGRIDVSRNCKVTGRVVIGGFETLITDARMSREKNLVHGAGKNVGDGAPVSFSASRRPVEVVRRPDVERRDVERRDVAREKPDRPAEPRTKRPSETKKTWWRFW